MQKKYIVRLGDQDRAELKSFIKKLSGTGQKENSWGQSTMG